MVKLANTFNHFQPFSALVIGDFLLDAYTTGRVKRVSPEAPVPVLEVLKQEMRPGGAGNVVLNLAALGGKVFAVGRIGADFEGSQLKERLEKEGVDSSALLVEEHYKTPVKTRLIADSQQLLRVDIETITPLAPFLEKQMVEQLQQLIPQSNIVALSDYGKGFLTPFIITSAIQIARRANIPLLVDPKGIDFKKYAGATIIKPNLIEAYAAAKLPLTASLDQVAEELLKITDVDSLMITRSEAGISVFDRTGLRRDFPVRSKEVKDVTGAGDTVLSILCLSLASGLDICQAAQLANIGAGLSIERLGCIQVTLPELAERLLEFDSDTKIFDESHTYALKQVLRGKPYSLLVLQNGKTMTHALFRALQSLSGKNDRKLILYVNDPTPEAEFIHLLSSFGAINAIILQSENLKNLCQAIHPHEAYFLEGENLSKLDLAKNLLTNLMEQKVLTPTIK